MDHAKIILAEVRKGRNERSVFETFIKDELRLGKREWEEKELGGLEVREVRGEEELSEFVDVIDIQGQRDYLIEVYLQEDLMALFWVILKE